MDEGFTGISTDYGSTVASLGMAEKGSLNVDIKVETLGGHSSVTPPHTGSMFRSTIHSYDVVLIGTSRDHVHPPCGARSQSIQTYSRPRKSFPQIPLVHIRTRPGRPEGTPVSGEEPEEMAGFGEGPCVA